jgi:serine/threonine protein phosphatase PrpC
MNAPAWVKLCEEDVLDEFFNKARYRFPMDQPELLYDDYGPDLYKAIWQPLEEELKGVGEKYCNQYSKSENLHHAYGTTLIAAAITEDFWFGIHIGDGRLTALYPDGTYDQPVPWDEKCYLNVTTSICDDDAYERARCYFSFHKEKQPPVAVFLCTDGIDDNYPVDGNEKHLFTLYRTIVVTFAEDGFESTSSQLKDLANSFATKGKGDDTSIAVLIDMEAIKEVVPIWKAQIIEEEAVENVKQ